MQEEVDIRIQRVKQVIEKYEDEYNQWIGEMRYARARAKYFDEAIGRQRIILGELITEKEKEEQCQNQQVLKD